MDRDQYFLPTSTKEARGGRHMDLRHRCQGSDEEAAGATSLYKEDAVGAGVHIFRQHHHRKAYHSVPWHGRLLQLLLRHQPRRRSSFNAKEHRGYLYRLHPACVLTLSFFFLSTFL